MKTRFTWPSPPPSPIYSFESSRSSSPSPCPGISISNLSSRLASCTLFLSQRVFNSAYIYLSVSFIQMLKAQISVAVYTIGVLLKKDTFNSDTMANMISISIGVGIAAYSEAKFDSFGDFLQLGVVAFEATRLVMIQILLTSKGITLNPTTSLYYVASCCLVFLFFPWVFVEFPILLQSHVAWHF